MIIQVNAVPVFWNLSASVYVPMSQFWVHTQNSILSIKLRTKHQPFDFETLKAARY